MWHWLNQSTFFGVLLLVAAGVGWRTVWFAHASKTWPTTPAWICHLGLRRVGKRGDKYRLVAQYSYVVNGLTYESTRWRFGSSPGGDMYAVSLGSAEIKPVDPIVFYDPNRPSRSCLVAGIDEPILAMATMASVLGVTVLVAGIW